MKELTLWSKMLFFFALALIPGYFVYHEFTLIYDGLWDMWADYSFQKEMFVRGHIFNAMLWFIPMMILFAIADRVGTTPEERRRVKELVQQQRERDLRRMMQPRFLPRTRL